MEFHYKSVLKLFKANCWSSNMTQCDWCDIDFWSKFKMLWLLNIEKKAFSPTPRVPAASVIRRCFSNLKYDQRWPIWSVPSVRILAPQTCEHFSCSFPFGWIDAFDWGNLLQKKLLSLPCLSLTFISMWTLGFRRAQLSYNWEAVVGIERSYPYVLHLSYWCPPPPPPSLLTKI